MAQLLLDRGDALPYDLAGVKVLVTAGGTREPIDPVRFIGNRSSGKQGYAMARVAAQRGAEVTLIAGNTVGPHRPGRRRRRPRRLGRPVARRRLQARARCERAGDGRRGRRLPARAVGDQQDQERPPTRRRRPTIELVRNDDVLAGAVRGRADGQLPNMRAIVGFAAETGDANGDVLFHARAKLAAQRLRFAGGQRGRRRSGLRGR